MSQNSKLERVFKNTTGVPYAGHPVTVTEKESNTWVRLYTKEGSLVSTNGETFTDSQGKVSVYVRDDRMYELTLRQKDTRVPLMTLRSQEANLVDTVWYDPADSGPGGGTSQQIRETSIGFVVVTSGANRIPLVQTQAQINLGNRLYINGILQEEGSYSVNTAYVDVPLSLNVFAGDHLVFRYYVTT